MDVMQNIQDRIAPYLGAVRDLMSSSLSSDVDILNRTNESILDNGGKMLRPTLTVLCASACDGAGELNGDVIRCAAAAELLHNATLMHDDVVDNSPTRRGAPTVMSILGSGPAVLLGDYWLVKAMDNILDTRRYPLTTRLFTGTLSDMALGEMLQIEKATLGDTSFDDYYRIIYYKTTSLFQTASLSGALSMGASQEVMDTIRSYAYALGQAFQIKDDILDYVGDSSLGKPLGQDLDERKITLPLLCSLDVASPTEASRIRSLVKSPVLAPEAKAEILSFVEAKDGIAGAGKIMGDFVEKGREALLALPPSRSRDDLGDLIGFVGSRNY